MSRFLLSAAAVCALCVAMTGSADAAVRVNKQYIGPKGNLVQQSTVHNRFGSTTTRKITTPYGATKVVRFHR